MTRLFIKNAIMPFSKLAFASALSVGLLAVPASASDVADTLAGEQPKTIPTQKRVKQPVADRFAKFVPQAQTKSTQINYDIWGDFLRDAVIYLGPSTRRRMGLPERMTGTRFNKGHRSAYRLEGSRVRFSEFDAEFMSVITAYRQDLESLPGQIDLTRFSKNEQLAYWLNLHNVALIERVGYEYPVRFPSESEIDGVKLHDAKILTVKGTPLSLRDIRENIVYPNWSSPRVVYGFFLGDIGGPMIPNDAFTAKNVDTHLRSNAEEFVNSLRGVHERSKTRNVSRIYNDVRRFYFPNFDADLTAHLLAHARPDVTEEIQSAKPLLIDRYDRVIADLEGGERAHLARRVAVIDRSGIYDASTYPYQYMKEIDVKVQMLKRRGLVGTSEVTIEDIETDDKALELEPRP